MIKKERNPIQTKATFVDNLWRLGQKRDRDVEWKSERCTFDQVVAFFGGYGFSVCSTRHQRHITKYGRNCHLSIEAERRTQLVCNFITPGYVWYPQHVPPNLKVFPEEWVRDPIYLCHRQLAVICGRMCSMRRLPIDGRRSRCAPGFVSNCVGYLGGPPRFFSMSECPDKEYLRGRSTLWLSLPRLPAGYRTKVLSIGEKLVQFFITHYKKVWMAISKQN